MIEKSKWELIFNKYISNHLKNKNLPKTIKLLISQHKEDIKNKSLPYYFDPKTADKYCKLISSFYIINDVKMKFKLEPFQVFIIFLLTGWRRVDNSKRRYTFILYSVARKNGKSEFLAGLLLALSLLEGVTSNIIDVIANTMNQIKKSSFAAIGQMLKNTFPDLVTRKQIKINIDKIIFDNTTISVLADNPGTLDGLKSNMVLIDEMHESYNPAKMRDLKSGTSARSSPLVAVTTTSGKNKKSDYYALYLKATDSLYGTVRDMESLYVVYEKDKTDDIYNTELWIKPNPGLYTIKNPAEMLKLLQTANINPLDKEELYVKHLNSWMDGGAKKYIDVDVLKKCFVPTKEVSPVWSSLAFDLSQVDDLTCYTLTIFEPNKKPYQILKSFVAGRYLEEKMSENPRYREWIEQGKMEVAGEVIDQEYIFERMKEDIDKYNVRHIGYDKSGATILLTKLNQTYPEILFKPINQKLGMTEPLQYFADALATQKIEIEHSTILEWMADNAIYFRNGNYTVIKKLSSNPRHKIDGLVSSVMSFYMFILASLQPTQKPVNIYW